MQDKNNAMPHAAVRVTITKHVSACETLHLRHHVYKGKSMPADTSLVGTDDVTSAFVVCGSNYQIVRR